MTSILPQKNERKFREKLSSLSTKISQIGRETLDVQYKDPIKQFTYRIVAVVGRHSKMSTDELDALHQTLFSTCPFVTLPWLKHRFPQSACK